MGRVRTRRAAGRSAERVSSGVEKQPATFGPGARESLAILALFAAVWLLTANSLGSQFILDDESKIVANTDIRRLGDLPSKLIYPYQQNQLLERNDPSRPLVFLVYAATYHFYGPSPTAFHAVNAVVHFASAALVFLLSQSMLWYLTGARKLAAPLIVALLFLATPIQVGTAAYAYALSDLLSGFLMLAALYAFVRAPRPGAAGLAVSVVAMALALLAKQSAIVVPILVLAFDYFIVCRMEAAALKSRLRLYLPFAALIAIYISYRFWYFGALGDIEGRGNTHPALAYFFTQPVVILKYLFSSLVPYHLAIDHYLLPGSFTSVEKAVALVILLALAAPLAVLWKRRTPVARFVLFATVFYLVVLAPTSSFMPTVDVMVERRVYLANAGLFLLVALAWDRLGRLNLLSDSTSTVTVTLVCVQMLALAGVSLHRNEIYATNEGAWLDVLDIYPASERALNNLGNVYLAGKQYEKARPLFAQLVTRNPADYIAQQNLGSIYEREDSPFHDADKAIAYFKAAVKSNPDFAEGFYNLGRLYQKLAQQRRDPSLVSEAASCYTRVLALNPSHVLAHNNLGLIYFHQGRREEARKEYETALRLDSNCQPALANLKLLDAPQAGPADMQPVPLDQVPRETLIKLYEDALRQDPNNKAIRQKYEALVGRPAAK